MSFQKLGSFCETNNTDRNGVNKRNTPNTRRKITLERVSMKINYTPPPYFTNPSLWKKSEPLPSFFQKFRKLYKGGGGDSNYRRVYV